MRKRTYKYSYAYLYEAEKAILEENRRDRDSKIIGYLWYINFAFPKTAKDI